MPHLSALWSAVPKLSPCITLWPEGRSFLENVCSQCQRPNRRLHSWWGAHTVASWLSPSCLPASLLSHDSALLLSVPAALLLIPGTTRGMVSAERLVEVGLSLAGV